MPYTLKGIDAIVFGAFKALGLKTTVKPRLRNPFYGNTREYVGDKLRCMVKDPHSGGYERDTAENIIVRTVISA